MTQRLFAYGTLLPGLAPPGLATRIAGLHWEGEARVRGRLYDLGSYPGAVLDPGGDGFVHGRLARVGSDAALWALLDRYEGVEPGDPDGGLFRRVRCEAWLAGGGRARVWIYEYARDPGAAARLRDGRYPPGPPRGTLGGPAGRTA